MREFTFRELCYLYREYSDDACKCDCLRSEYLSRNKGNYKFELLDKEDVEGLRPFLLCDILAMYEYIAIMNNAEMPDWFSDYDGVTCPMAESDMYDALLDNPIAPQNAEIIYKSMIENAIEPFKSRGITCDVFDYTV